MSYLAFCLTVIVPLAAFILLIVIPYQPRALVLYAGENDIARVFFSKKKTPAEVAAAYRQFCEQVHTALPQTPISSSPFSVGRHPLERQRLRRLDSLIRPILVEYWDSVRRVP